MNLSGEILELPAVGDTLPGERTTIRAVDSSGTAVTISEACEMFAVSGQTLRRRIKEGEIEGASKRPGPKGEEWSLPVVALERLGYVRLEAHSAPVASTPVAGVVELLGLADRLASMLEVERLALRAAESDRSDARAAAADALARLEMTETDRDKERTRADALAVELETALKRRKRFRRK